MTIAAHHDAARPMALEERKALAVDALSGIVIDSVLARDPEFRKYGKPPSAGGLADYLFATGDEPHTPEDIFPRLRWGGQFVYTSANRHQVAEVARQFQDNGFLLEREPSSARRGRFFLPFIGRKVYYFVARKIYLIRQGETTERFTYHVELLRHARGGEYVVSKQVPSLESVVERLRKRWPELPQETLEKRARKFTDKIFPTFLTREAAILKILQAHLPAAYARRVPQVVAIEKDDRGFVRKLRMNWLRNGGRRPLSQLEFAMQSADLLRAVHDAAEVIHLDLRLDNFVITENGVGFVDFGSSVRVGEDLQQNPLLSTLFEELMRTSQIQRMLERMTHSGHVTSEVLCGGRGRVDKAVDLFYLAVQFNAPHANPDLSGLIAYDPQSGEAKALSQLTQEVLRPTDPANPPIRTAKDVLRALELVEARLKG